MKKPITFEQVEWIDSRGVTDRWLRMNDLKDHGVCHMLSVGWIIHENEKEIQIAPHLGVEEDFEETQACGVMTIPKECIKLRTRLAQEG